MIAELYSDEERNEFAKFLMNKFKRDDGVHDEFSAIAFTNPEGYRNLISTIMFGVSLAMLAEEGSNFSAIKNLCHCDNIDLVKTGIMAALDDQELTTNFVDFSRETAYRNARHFIDAIAGTAAA